MLRPYVLHCWLTGQTKLKIDPKVISVNLFDVVKTDHGSKFIFGCFACSRWWPLSSRALMWEPCDAFIDSHYLLHCCLVVVMHWSSFKVVWDYTVMLITYEMKLCSLLTKPKTGRFGSFGSFETYKARWFSKLPRVQKTTTSTGGTKTTSMRLFWVALVTVPVDQEGRFGSFQTKLVDCIQMRHTKCMHSGKVFEGHHGKSAFRIFLRDARWLDRSSVWSIRSAF